MESPSKLELMKQLSNKKKENRLLVEEIEEVRDQMLSLEQEIREKKALQELLVTQKGQIQGIEKRLAGSTIVDGPDLLETRKC